MTIREAYENCLIELNKVQAPSLLLLDFVYLFNKAIQLYFNKRYNLFEINQLLTDDLRVLTKTIKVTPELRENGEPVFGESYKVELPDDYVHILNCICEFEDLNPKKICKESDRIFQYGANKLDTNQWSSVITNYYMRPSVKLPYYYIINITDPDIIRNPKSHNEGGERYGNTYKPKLEIKCGNIKGKYALRCVYIDYLRAPRYVDLTVEDLDAVEDNTFHLEFPDYVVYEIINEIVSLAMENGKDPRLLTFIPVNQTVPAATAQK